ncbi:hypothetical protein [Planktotalea sp.]|uniref:hypothetical protein n=1 Tax=Planktotalea sp. TaxID=2029877 RepID=UPI00329A7649
MLKPILTVFAFGIVSFAVQGLSHFVINVEHFASIDFLRKEPVIPLGLTAMIVQALIFSFVMAKLFPMGASLSQCLAVVASFGIFLGIYIALAEPAKYAAPSIPAWIMFEATASTLQFLLFSIPLWLIYRKP